MEPSAAVSAALDARDDLNDRDQELLLALTPAERRAQSEARELVLDHLAQIMDNAKERDLDPHHHPDYQAVAMARILVESMYDTAELARMGDADEDSE